MIFQKNISFRSLQESDFEQLYLWLQTPEVVRFWDNRPITYEAMVEKYRKRIFEDVIKTYVFCVDEMPIGLIQCYIENRIDLYRIDSFGVGVDMFIGEVGFLHKGFGSQALQTFIREVVIPMYHPQYVCIDPDEDNLAAIKSYTKVGFHPVNIALCPDCGTHNTVFMVLKIEEGETSK